jgi:hypothetical protein
VKVVRATGALLLLVLLARGARAQEPADVERAKESFKAGATAYAAGDYPAAIQAFDRAYELTPLPPIAFSLAQSERRQYFVGHERPHLDRAIALFRRYVEQVTTGGRRADALDALSQLEPLAAARAASELPAASAAPAARPTRLLVTSDTPGAQLSLDGGAPAPSPLIREVEPGAHHVTVSAAGFFASTRDVIAVAGELVPVAVSLREQPSSLVVGAPAGAEIYVDGALAGRGGEGAAFQLANGAHVVAVAEKGHRVALRPLELGPGEARHVDVSLEPTRQRRAARLLFVASGAGLVSGVVLAVLAASADSRAGSFLDRYNRGNVTAADLRSYDATIADRDHYRVALAINLTAVAGLAITGALLYELDDPDAREIRRPAEGPALRVTPLLTAGGGGAGLQGKF